jgi:hypothetical protein
VRGGAKEPIVNIEILAGDGAVPFTYSLAVRFLPDSAGRNPQVELEKYVSGKNRHEFQYKLSLTNVCGVRRGAVAVNEELRGISDLIYLELSGIHFYRFDARMLSLPAAPDSARRFRMGPEGFGLALCLDDILGFDREAFGRVEDRFRQIFPEIRSVKLLPQPAYRAPLHNNHAVPMLSASDGKGIFFQLTRGGGLIPAAQASEGALLVLAYLAILGLPKPPRVLLVEEPENGIHPKRLQQVLAILRDVVSGQAHTQVILTTHSPYLLDMLSPEEVTLCQRDDRGEINVRRLSEVPSVRQQLDVFTLGEIWTAEEDDKLSAAAGTEAGK